MQAISFDAIDPQLGFNRLQEHLIPNQMDPDSRWKHLICRWNEKKDNGEMITHIYAACFDEVESGIYLDCPPRKIYAKCLGHLIVRPLHSLLKTISHILMLPIIYEIAKTWQGDQSKDDCIKNSIKSLVDIVRTPLYGLVLTVATIGALILGAVNPESLYSSRAFLGKIEQQANWGDIHTDWTLAHCFQPFPMSILTYYANKDCIHDTFYNDSDPLEKALANLARARVRFMRHHFDLFSCRKLDSDSIYISPVLAIRG